MISRIQQVLAVLALASAGCGSTATDDSTDGGAGVDAGPPAEPTAFRVSQMTLVDPHAFALNVADVTDNVNELIADGLTMDGDDPADGDLDLNIAIVLRPLDQAAGAVALEVAFPECSAPVGTTMCTLPAGADVAASTGTNMDSTCLDAIDGTTSYSPPVTATEAPCVVSEPEMLTVPLGDLMIPLIDAQIAGTYADEPATRLEGGLVRGFLTQAAADAAIIPEDVALLGGQPVSAMLKAEDKDPGPSGEDGWWFYLSIEADVVPYSVAQ